MRHFPVLSLLVLTLFWGGAAGVVDPAPGVDASSPPSTDWLARAQQSIAEREYRASPNRQGLQAPNRAQNLRTWFEPTGIRVHDRTAAGSPRLLALSLIGVGRGDALAEPEAGEVSSDGARVEIRRGNVLEWYENSAAGLEQGFTLAERPVGDGPLVLELAVDGATASRRGDALVFATATGRKLRYGELRAWDAAGDGLDARLDLGPTGRIRLEVADADAAYPLTIDPLLTATWDAQLESDQSGAELGSSVAGAGDVNGDGYADVIVGALYYDAGELNEGAAFVFLGGPDGIADATPATAHAQLESNQINALLGISVAGAGDVNGDGYDDVIVGAWTYDAVQTNEGAAFVFLGSSTGIADGNPATAHAQLESDQANAQLGNSVAGAGDVNGDGYDDVIVGAHYASAGQTNEGIALVFLGSATGIADGNPGNAHALLQSDQDSALFGFSVAGAGDVNGDGYDDVIVGAPSYDASALNGGAAFVFLGGATGIADADPTTAHAQLESAQTSADLGASVAGAGDVNGDGYADVIVGAPSYDAGSPNEGAAFVFLGGATGIADGDPTTAHAQLESDQLGADLGMSVAGAGDVNGDGYADVIVGAWLYDGGLLDEGAAFVFLGGAAGIADGDPTTAYAQLETDQFDARLGFRVAGAGDLNGDGFADVIVGAHLHDAGETDEGAAFVFLGGATGISDGDPATAHAAFESDEANAQLGRGVGGAGDVNGDGYGDVIVGAPSYDTGQADAGAAFVFLGDAAGITGGGPAFADAQLESDQTNSGFGIGVAGAGDVNGDGYDDVIVGAPTYDAGETNEGAAFVFLGSAAGIASGGLASANARIESNQASGNLGVSVAGAGDVNGDGYADVIVGADAYDDGEANEGAAFVFLGSPTGIADGSPATAHARLEADQPGAFLGREVAGAGDVNGDGYADLIVGAPFYDAGETDEGAAFVFLGSATGVADGNPANAHAQLESDQPGAYFGSGVDGAGDVNGDGYADLIVGAPLYDAGEANEGAAFVFLGHAFGIVGFDPPTAHAQLESDQGGVSVGSTFGESVAGIGDVNGDGYADVAVGAQHYSAGQADEGAAFVFLGGADGMVDADPSSAHAWLVSGQAGSFFGLLVAGAGDVNGDGYADLIAGAYRYDAGQTNEGAAFLFLGNGNQGGYPVRAQQLEGNAGSAPIPSWGSSANDDTFQITLTAKHPEGRGRVKLECEICPPDVAFGHPSCLSHVSPAWIPVTPPTGAVRVAEAIGGLSAGTLYRWRVRVLRAPDTGPAPLVPSHGPWRRLNAQAGEGDVRLLPEPGVAASLLAGALALGVLKRRRTRAGGAPLSP